MVPSVEAATVDVPGSVEAIATAMVAGTREVELLVRASPAITDELATAAAERGEQLIDTEIRLALERRRVHPGAAGAAAGD